MAIGLSLAFAIKPELTAGSLTDSNSFYQDYYTPPTSPSENVTNLTAIRTLRADGRVVELVLNIGYAMFTISLLYGVIKGHAKFLLPFFCLQVFEFCIHCLVIVGYFTYEPNIKTWIASWKWFPLRNELLELNTGWLMLIFGLVAILYLWVKAYFISVVWSCYKFLVQMSLTAPVISEMCTVPTCDISLDYLGGRPTISNYAVEPAAFVMPPDHNPTDSQIMLPPKYEDVLQMTDMPAAVSPPPPPYCTIIGVNPAFTEHR